MDIRLAEPTEIPLLPALEDAAGEIFREVGMPEIASGDGQSADALESYRRAGHAWVAVDGATVAGFLVAEVVDGGLHIEQVSVHPSYARKGVGGELIEYAAAYAVSRGLPALTLTTFVDVPWNAPYYARLGFGIVPPAAETPGLREIRDHERALGLDRWPRTCMRRAM